MGERVPELNLFDALERAKRIVHLVFDHHLHEGLSDHNTGAAPALDRQLYEAEGSYYYKQDVDPATTLKRRLQDPLIDRR